MNARTARRIRIVVWLFTTAVVQAALGRALEIGGAQPDLLAAVALILATFSQANGAAGIGFIAGLFHACIAAPPHGGFGSLIVSATLVCFGVGWLQERLLHRNLVLAVLLVTAGTLAGELLFFVMAPQHAVGHWARAVAGTVVYNTLLAAPLYALVRRSVAV